MKLIWLSDIHLNFLAGEQVYAFLDKVRAEQPDAVLVGGDIGEADDFDLYLREMVEVVDRPIYFVLGNHDFYRGTIPGVRAKAEAICREVATLHWLSQAGAVQLTEEIGLVGHGGWGDGRCGDYMNSRIPLSDFELIGDFLGLDKLGRLRLLNQLGDEAAIYLRGVLPEAASRFRRLILLTHVPPFKEAAWHEGRISSPDWLPFMTCQATGDVIRQIMGEHPGCDMTVLCGHTHGGGETRILDNLRVLTGGAEYGQAAKQLDEPQRNKRLLTL